MRGSDIMNTQKFKGKAIKDDVRMTLRLLNLRPPYLIFDTWVTLS